MLLALLTALLFRGSPGCISYGTATAGGTTGVTASRALGEVPPRGIHPVAPTAQLAPMVLVCMGYSRTPLPAQDDAMHTMLHPCDVYKARLRSEVVVRLVVVGGGYGGVEIACNLATELVRGWGGRAEVTLVTNSEVLAMATPGNREAGLRRLRESGVRVLTGTGVGEVRDCGVVVLRPSNDDSSITAAEEIRSDLLIWTAGSQPNSVLASTDAAKDTRGRLKVDRRLQLTRSEAPGISERDSSTSSDSGVPSGEVFCLGDVAAVQGLDLGANAQVAIQQADYVAYNVWAQETGRQMLDFRYVNLGEMISLGGLEASLTALDGRVKLGGKAAGLLRRAIYAVGDRRPVETVTRVFQLARNRT